MKITLRRNKGKKTTSVRFRADSSAEGAALAKAVMAAGVAKIDSSLPVRIIEELHKNGVEKADFDLKVVEPKRRAKA